MSDEMYHPSAPCNAVPAAPALTSRRRQPFAGLAALAVAGIGAFALAATDAAAANTRPSIDNFAPSQQQILANALGGSFAHADAFSGDTQRASDEDADHEAEQIFESDFVSARGVAGFARNSQAFGSPDGESQVVPLLRTQRNALDAAGPVDLRGPGLSNTILALQTGGTTDGATSSLGRTTAAKPVNSGAASVAPDAFLLFWEEPTSTSEHDYSDTIVQVNSVDGAGSATVLIPVPPAALSGLIVMGAFGIASGIKRLRRGR